VTSSTAAPVEPADLSRTNDGRVRRTCRWICRSSDGARRSRVRSTARTRTHVHRHVRITNERGEVRRDSAASRGQRPAGVGPMGRVRDARAHGEVTVTRGKRDVSNCPTFRFDSRFLRLSARETEHACTQIFRRKNNNEIR